MSDQSPDVGISLSYDNLANLPNILSPKVYIDFTNLPVTGLPATPPNTTDSLSFHDIYRFNEPLFGSTIVALTWDSSYDKQLLYFEENKIGFMGGFSLTSQGFYCKSFFTPPLDPDIWEVSLAFVDFFITENDSYPGAYPDGYVGEGIWAVFSSETQTMQIRYLDQAQDVQVLGSAKFSLQNTAGNPVEIGFQWDGFKSFKAYYGNNSIIARSDISDSFGSGLFYPVATIDSIVAPGPGPITGGMDSLEFGCSIGFNNTNPSGPERGVTLGNISTSDYVNLETVDQNSFTSTVRSVGLDPVFTLDTCPPEYCNPAGDVEEGSVRVGVFSGDELKFEEPICEYLRSDFFEGGLYGYYSNGDKIRIVESSLGDKYLVSRNLDTGQFNFIQVIDGEIGNNGVYHQYVPGDMVDFDWFNDRLWICGQDSGYSIRSFSEASDYISADINIANPSTCNSIAYHQESNSFYASYPEDDAIIQYDADDGSVLDTLYVTSFDIIKLLSCGDYIGIIDRESAAVNVLSDDSAIRFLDPETNTIIDYWPASDPNDAIYDSENNCVYLFFGETSPATPSPENDGTTIAKLPLNTISNATPIASEWFVSNSGAERNVSDLFVHNNQIYIVSNGDLYIRSTSNGSLISTENFDPEQQVLSISHETIDGATPSDIVWTLGIDTNATPVADGNMLFSKNCSIGNKLGIKSRIVAIGYGATPLDFVIQPDEIPDFINECASNNTIPCIVIYMENWDNVEINKQGIDEIIDYIHGSFYGATPTPIPVFLMVLPTPDLQYDDDLTGQQALAYWRIYQKYTRRVLDSGINNGAEDYNYISFCVVISSQSISQMIDNESLEAENWIENTWDIPILFAPTPVDEDEWTGVPPFDYTPDVLLGFANPYFDWFVTKDVSKIMIAFAIDFEEQGFAAADFYQSAYDLAISSGISSATPNVEPQIVGLIINDFDEPASGRFLRQIKLSLGYETSLMANEGRQTKALYNSETSENFASYATNFILDNQISHLIFGSPETFENIVQNSEAGEAGFESVETLMLDVADLTLVSNVVSAGGRLWVGAMQPGGDDLLLELDPLTGEVLRSTAVPLDPLVNTNTLATDGTYIFLVTQGEGVRRYIVADPAISPAFISLSYPTVDAVYEAGFLWVAEETPTPRILKINPNGFTVADAIDLTGYTEINALHHDGTSLWFASAEERELVKVNATTGAAQQYLGSVSISADPFPPPTIQARAIASTDTHVVLVYGFSDGNQVGGVISESLDLSGGLNSYAPTLIDEVSPLGDYWWARFDEALSDSDYVTLSYRHYFFPGGEDNGNAGGLVRFDPTDNTIIDSVVYNDGYNEVNGTIFGLSEANGDIYFHNFSFPPGELRRVAGGEPAAETPVDKYIELFNSIQENIFGAYKLYGPNIDISPRYEGYNVSYNGVLMDSRYVGYLENFIDSLNSATPTFNPAGLAFAGDFSSEGWANALSYIRDTLLFTGEILISDIDSRPSIEDGFYDSNIAYKQKSQAVISELGDVDKVFLTDNYIFTGSFEYFTSEWAFVGSLNMISQANNVIFSIVNYTESILADGYLEIESDGATPYSYFSDLPISGSLINLGNLGAGTYSVKIFGTIAAEGEAHMNLKFEFDNFDDISLSLKDYFYLGGGFNGLY